jgi:CIC family chloride channel protein
MLGALVSQAISRTMLKHSFYDELLKQDGVNLEQVQPPRDLRSWQQLPASAIANFEPTVVRSLSAADLAKLLKESPYARFPVVEGERLVGILTREDAERAVRNGLAPKLLPPVSVLPQHSVESLQAKLIESEVGVVVLVDQPNGKVLGLVTLHDILRAQTAMTKDSEP